ncbi:MAG: YCF48-related protein [Bacteroidota bacterium]|nr:YCF48-related protein [Bacteroidota bacterium]
MRDFGAADIRVRCIVLVRRVFPLYRFHGVFRFFLLFVLFRIPAFTQGWEWQNPLPRGGAVNDIIAVGNAFAVAVCEDGTVLVSEDQGAYWRPVRLAFTSLDKVHAFPNGTVITAGQDGLIARCTDWGWTWTKRAQNPLTSYYSTDIAGIDDSTAVVKMGYDDLYVTADCGDTWEKRNVGVAPDHVRFIAVQTPTIWWTGTNTFVYRSTDAGRSWKRDTTIDARGLNRLVFADSLYGWQVRDGALLRTRDGGSTWVEMDVYGFGNHLDVFCTGPDGRTVFCVGDGAYVVNKSTDGGDTWNISLTGTAFAESYPLAASFATERIGYVVGDAGRILRTLDGGESWAVVHGSGYPGSIVGIVAADSLNAIALTWSHTVLVTSNGGSRWDETVPFDDLNISCASFYDARGGYACGRDRKGQWYALHLDLSRRAWTIVGALPIAPDPILDRQPEGIVSVSRDTVLIGVSYGNLLRSVDGGKGWDSLLVSPAFVSQFGTGRYLFFFKPASIVYAGGNGIALSDDLGRTWSYRSTPQQQYLYQAQFLTPSTGFVLVAGGSGGVVYRTTDGGASWRTVFIDGAALFSFFNELSGVVLGVGSDGGSVILHTDDGGSTWQSYRLNERVAWRGWLFRSRQTGWAWGAGGCIRYTTNGGIADVTPPRRPSHGVLSDAPFPNPVHRHCHHDLHVPLPRNTSRAEYAVFDALGRRVTAGELAGGYEKRSMVIDVTALRPGLYTVHVSAGGEIFSRDFIVVE